MKWNIVRCLAISALGAFVAGCGETDSVVDAYRESDGDLGLVHFVVDADAPLVQGTNDLRISLHEVADDAPIMGANPTLMAMMPAMAHGNSESPAIKELGEGVYLAPGLSLPMAGRWEIHVGVMLADKLDSVKFTYDLR